MEVQVRELNEGMWVHFSFHSEVGLDGTERNRKFLRTALLLAELEVSLRCPPCMRANNAHACACCGTDSHDDDALHCQQNVSLWLL